MNKKPSVSVIAALLLLNACGSRVGVSEEPVLGSAPVVVDVGDVPSSTDPVTKPERNSLTTTTTVVSADAEVGPSNLGSDEIPPAPDQTSESTVPRSSTPSTALIGQDAATTQPQVDVDLDGLTEALRELDELLGLFDSQVDSVDLDETEGEAP